MGYHGCDKDVGESILAGGNFKQSENSWDWLGSGVYFWEANPERGLEFAHEQANRKNPSKKYDPFVIGAVIDLGYCFDLTTKTSVDYLEVAYSSYLSVVKKAAQPLPVNDSRGKHHLDCAVINHMHEIMRTDNAQPLDTVKGLFIEGEPVFESSRFMKKTHIQICVRNLECIKGVFRVNI